MCANVVIYKHKKTTSLEVVLILLKLNSNYSAATKSPLWSYTV